MKQFISLTAILMLTACSDDASEPPFSTENMSQLPAYHNSGSWDSGHVQGIAVDTKHGYLYYSFTDLLLKYDFEGNLIATLDGWSGHLGDLDFNPENGHIYGSLEYKEDQAFYIAVVNGEQLNRIGMDAREDSILNTVFLQEVTLDYTADMNGDGVFDGNTADTPDHRYGSSGIDGVSFGPAFGRTDGPHLLTVAYGIYSNTQRNDNDHQVLLQYDISQWEGYEQPLSEAAPHRNGPAEFNGKYFVYTGNTTYGVQNLAYDSSLQRWFMGVYQGKKPHFPNYLLFAVDADAAPQSGSLTGVKAENDTWEQALLLPLADDGLEDSNTGIRGWIQKADVGMQPLGNGLFYLATNEKIDGKESATLSLMQWTGNPQSPFEPVTQTP